MRQRILHINWILKDFQLTQDKNVKTCFCWFFDYLQSGENQIVRAKSEHRIVKASPEFASTKYLPLKNRRENWSKGP